MTYHLEIAARNVRIQRLVRDLAKAYQVDLGATFDLLPVASLAAREASTTLGHLIQVRQGGTLTQIANRIDQLAELPYQKAMAKINLKGNEP